MYANRKISSIMTVTCFTGCLATGNKGNAKRGISPRLKIRPHDLENQEGSRFS